MKTQPRESPEIRRDSNVAEEARIVNLWKFFGENPHPGVWRDNGLSGSYDTAYDCALFARTVEELDRDLGRGIAVVEVIERVFSLLGFVRAFCVTMLSSLYLLRHVHREELERRLQVLMCDNVFRLARHAGIPFEEATEWTVVLAFDTFWEDFIPILQKKSTAGVLTGNGLSMAMSSFVAHSKVRGPSPVCWAFWSSKAYLEEKLLYARFLLAACANILKIFGVLEKSFCFSLGGDLTPESVVLHSAMQLFKTVGPKIENWHTKS